jgi:hypothetical protein
MQQAFKLAYPYVTYCYVPEDRIVRNHLYENLKSYTRCTLLSLRAKNRLALKELK